jgi:hypothetical protein
VSADLTRRVYQAAEKATTAEETAQAVCREVAAWLTEEATIFAARHAPQDGSGLKGGDWAHASVLEQIVSHLSRVGDERHPS